MIGHIWHTNTSYDMHMEAVAHAQNDRQRNRQTYRHTDNLNWLTGWQIWLMLFMRNMICLLEEVFVICGFQDIRILHNNAYDLLKDLSMM